MSDHAATATADRDGAAPAPGAGRPAGPPVPEPLPDVLVADLLVEEVSIDGMCGVY
ncbi:MAG TPA: mycofactocin precursor MftA [Streptosporangiaceae bacterium]|nr:mycofactocin precursor MftA [Streptosporangiaceae bacterium]